jgi:hypothetical protein
MRGSQPWMVVTYQVQSAVEECRDASTPDDRGQGGIDVAPDGNNQGGDRTGVPSGGCALR